jgi:hypothetical protein
MRMWMVDPRRMCRKHLLGEHVELHMLAASISLGRSIAGFLEKKLVEPQSIGRRHAALRAEMLRRGYQHQSPLRQPATLLRGAVRRPRSAQELSDRCLECRKLLQIKAKIN